MTRATTLTAFRDAAPAADVVLPAAAACREAGRDATHDLNLRIHGDLANVEAEWRRFEAVADCTVFQTFDWLAAWHRHIGLRARVQPAVAVGRFANGDTAFIVPLCVAPHGPARRLCWLGQELCDYNAPLLARDFSERVTAERFLEVWRELRLRLQQDPLFRHDWIDLEKMPQTLGAQRNPFTCLDVSPNASGAHLTQLGGGWEEFYTAKRSSATRRRDRAKRRHMSEYGDVQFATAAEAADARRTLEILMEQNSRALVRKGVADMFARPGWREFFLDLATNPQTRQLVHVARLQVGADAVAANFGVVFGGCYYHVLASYCEDSRAAHFGPGALHLRELLKYAIERGLQRFDFTIGDERYKLEWCDSSVKLYDHAAADLAGLAGSARYGRAAPAQAPDQADALGVERGLRRPHCAWLILAPGAAVKRAATGRRREHPPDARQWSGFDIRARRAATRKANVKSKAPLRLIFASGPCSRDRQGRMNTAR